MPINGELTFPDVPGKINEHNQSPNAHSVRIDNTVSQSGMAADAKATRDLIENVSGQIEADVDALDDQVTDLKSAIGDKSSLNTDTKTNLVSAINEVNGHFLDGIDTAVENWLDDHPEATTTVQDGSITATKIAPSFNPYIVKDFYTPEMFGAVGDGETDDTEALRECFRYSGMKMVLLSKRYKITEKIVITASQPTIVGTSPDRAKIWCYGNGGLEFRPAEGTRTLYEVRLTDFQLQNFSENTTLLSLVGCYNVYVTNVMFVSYTTENTLVSIGDDSGIIFFDGCTFDGGSSTNDIVGLSISNIGTVVSIKKSNIWNLQTVIYHAGRNLEKLMVYDNWIERNNNFFVSEYTETGNRLIGLDIHGNTIATSNWNDRVMSDVKFISITGVATSNYFGSTITVRDNLLYYWDINNLYNNSMIDFVGGAVANGTINIYWDGNMFTGKRLAQLSTYIYKDSLSLGLNTIFLRVTNQLEGDVEWLSDNVQLLNFPIKTTYNYTLLPNGVNLNSDLTNRAINKGGLYYDNGKFYFGINGTIKTVPYNFGDDVKKIADTSSATAETVATKLNALINALVRSSILTSSGSE